MLGPFTIQVPNPSQCIFTAPVFSLELCWRTGGFWPF